MNKNLLLDLLPKKIQGAVLNRADLIELTVSQIIFVANEPAEYVYFPVDGFISITQSVDTQLPIEIGMIGREGVLGAEFTLGLGVNAFGAIVQGSGFAWRMRAKALASEMKKSTELKIAINGYIAVRMRMLGLSAACEHFHEIGPRFAKWLLMSQDRAQSSTFFMTHEFISLMLGVRRVGVTTTASDFRRRGLIDYRRGEIKILNRVALEDEACSCYKQNCLLFLRPAH